MDDLEYQTKVMKSNKFYHSNLNFYLPHEFGGCGEARQQELYGMFNIYTPEMDLAKINPRWTTKHEFMVDLPKNQFLEEPPEEIVDEPLSSIKISKRHSLVSNNDKLDFVKLFPKTVLKEFEEKTKPELEEKLALVKK